MSWREQYRAAYEDDGLTIREIARVVGDPYETVRRRLHQIGVKLRGRGPHRATPKKLTMNDVRIIHRRLAQGEAQASVARAFGITRQTVWKIHHGLTWKGVMS